MGRAQAAAQDESRPAGGLGGKLQAPPGGTVERIRLPNHGGQISAAQALLHGPENIDLAARADQDQAPGIEPESRQAGRIEIAPARGPQHRAARAGSQQTGQEGQAKPGRGAVVPFRPLALDLVQTGQRQAAARQVPVERRDPERQNPPFPRGARAGLKGPDLGPQAV